MAWKLFSSTGVHVNTLDFITFLRGATSLLYIGIYELEYENWHTRQNNSARLLGVLIFAKRFLLSTGMALKPSVLSSIPRKVTVEHKILHLRLFILKPFVPNISITKSSNTRWNLVPRFFGLEMSRSSIYIYTLRMLDYVSSTPFSGPPFAVLGSSHQNFSGWG